MDSGAKTYRIVIVHYIFIYHYGQHLKRVKTTTTTTKEKDNDQNQCVIMSEMKAHSIKYQQKVSGRGRKREPCHDIEIKPKAFKRMSAMYSQSQSQVHEAYMYVVMISPRLASHLRLQPRVC